MEMNKTNIDKISQELVVELSKELGKSYIKQSKYLQDYI